MPSRHKASLVISVIGILLISALIAGQQAADAQSRRCALTIVNSSSREIHRLYVSTSGAPRWGPDVLGNAVLQPGKSKTLENLNPGPYDVLMIDSEKRQCALRGFPVSRDNSWTITDRWLSECPQ
jgi:type II secretory pathway pseudopilin PulG